MPSLIGYDLVKELREMDPGHKYTLNTNLHDYITLIHYHNLGAVSIRKTVLQGMVIPMLKIRRPNGRLIFNMEIAIHR